MTRPHVDYDHVAPTYDQRFAANKPENVAHALLELAAELRARRILEVGCGTGHWLADLHAASAELYGLDLSTGMLTQARQRDARLRLLRGRAGQLPFPTTSFDLVYCVNAIHHFDCQREFVFEARRLLRPGGALAVVGSDPHGRRDSWYVYDYFPGTYETDLTRFPAWGTVLDWTLAAGFKKMSWQVVDHIREEKTGGEVLDDPFLRKNATSQLTLLTDDEYAAGLARIRRALESADETGETLVFRSDIVLGMLVGRP